MPKPRNLNPTEVAFRLAEIPGVAHNHRKVHGESPGMSSVPLGMRIEKVPQQAGLVCATAKGYWTPLLLPWPQSGGHNTRHQDGQAFCTRPCAWHSYQLPTRSAKAWSVDTCSIIRSCSHAPIAQWLEHWSYEPRVMGSNPIGDIPLMISCHLCFRMLCQEAQCLEWGSNPRGLETSGS